MTLEQQEKSFMHMTEMMHATLIRKGNDYAGQDRLSNFKLAGAIAGNSAEINCLNLIATKVARLGQLLSSGSVPNNESVRDSVLDLANYAVLLGMIIDENDMLKAKSYLDDANMQQKPIR